MWSPTLRKLHDAVRNDDLATVEDVLASHPYLVDARGEYGDYPTVLVPLWKRDPSANCDTACDYQRNKHDGRNDNGDRGTIDGPMLNLLEAHGAQIDIGLACLTGRVEIVQRHLSERPEVVNAPTPWAGDSLLQWAAWGNQPYVVALLAEKGAQLDVVSGDGQTPLHKAAHFGCDDAIVMLLEYGVDPYAIEPTADATPLVWAILRGHRHTADLFIAQGYDVNRVLDDRGNTMLHLESRFIDDYPQLFERFAEYLLANGADPRIANEDGITVIDLMRGTEHPALHALFGRYRGAE